MRSRPRFFDIETVALDIAKPLVKARSNLTDPKKIEADIAEKVDELAKDPLAARVICLGVDDSKLGPACVVMRSEDEERIELRAFWEDYLNRALVLCGYYIKRYDLVVMLNRSRMLGLTVPRLDLNRYHRDSVLDLYDEWTFYGAADSGTIPRSQEVACLTYGIALPDPLPNGAKDIAGLWATGTPDALAKIVAHCENDVRRTVALAKALDAVEDF